MSVIHTGNGIYYTLKDLRKFVEMTKDYDEKTWLDGTALGTNGPETVGILGLRTRDMYNLRHDVRLRNQDALFEDNIEIVEEICARSPGWYKVECTGCGTFSSGVEPVVEEWGYDHILTCEKLRWR